MTGEDIWAVFYKNMELIESIDKLVYYYRVQNLDRALRITTAALKKFSEAVPLYAQISDFLNEDMVRFDLDYVSSMLDELLSAQEKQDYELLPDLYELKLLPFINDIQGKIILSWAEKPEYNRYLYRANYQVLKEKMPELSKALNEAYIPQRILDEGYAIEYTSSGLPTLKINSGGGEYYLHSNGSPMKEAFYWALRHKISDENRMHYLSNQDFEENGRVINPPVFEYIIYGLGLGYHVKALSQMEPYAGIKVFESDINVIQLLCAFGDLKFFAERENVEIIYDPEFKKLNESLTYMDKDNAGGKFLVHYPSLCVVKSPFMKQKLENYFVQYSSVSNQLIHLNGNFSANLINYDFPVDALREKFAGKDLYIVAGGPSLDKNFNQLRDVREGSIILAVSTVFHKLMDAKIRPDYLMVTDASPRVVFHIRDYEEAQVPVIILSTACKAFGERYNGKRYIMLQKGYMPAENMAEKLGWTLFETGGSVSTAALDLGLRFSCRRVVFLGLDLSFPNDLAHAEGTSRRKITQLTGLREVRDVNGHMVKTNKSMDMYREWIEKRLIKRTEDEKHTEVIDATEGGALIQGMKVMPFSETLKGEKRNCGKAQKHGEAKNQSEAHKQGEERKHILAIKGVAKYGAMRKFADEVIEGMEDAGADVTLFDANSDPAPRLMELVEKTYDLVFAFNGVFTSADLPESVIGKLTDDGRNKCFSFFVDHPCHHDMRLRVFPPNNIAAFTDREHVSLVKEYFPKINPMFLPHGGDVYTGKIKPWNERSIDVLFCGSCYDISEYDATIEGMEDLIKKTVKSSIALLKENPSFTVREAMTQALLGQGVEKERINFGDVNMLRLHRFVDDYIRTWFRQEVIKSLAKSGIKVTLCGDGWEKMADKQSFGEGRENLEILGNLDYGKALEKMADAKIVLNVMPWFKDGSHERVFTAMRNQAVCLTDESRYLQEELKDYNSVQFYSLSSLEVLPGQINEILSGTVRQDGKVYDMEAETIRGKEFADENHSWQQRGREILKVANIEIRNIERSEFYGK